jgi:hypothetical protein
MHIMGFGMEIVVVGRHMTQLSSKPFLTSLFLFRALSGEGPWWLLRVWCSEGVTCA